MDIQMYNDLLQCNLDYPEPELDGHQIIYYYHACVEGVTSALCGCGYMLSDELWALQALPWLKLIMSDLFSTLLAIVILYRYRL